MKSRHRLLAATSVAGMAIAMGGLVSTAAYAQPDGSIGVNSTTDMVHGSGFGSRVTVTIKDNGVTTRFKGDQIQYSNGGFELYLQGSYDIHAGQIVTVSGSSATNTMTVSNVGITGWNFADNTVSGAATDQTSPNAVFVSVTHHPSTGEFSNINAWQTGGQWTTGSLGGAGPPFTLRVGDTIEACQPDAHDNESCVTRVAAGPRFAFGMELQEVVGLDWTPGSNVTLSIDRPPLGSADFTDSRMPVASDQAYGMWLQTGMGGTVYFDLTQGSFQAQPGDVMTMTQGAVTKTMTVPDLRTSLPDVATGTVSGLLDGAEPGGFLSVSSGQFAWGCGGQFYDAVPAPAGPWTTTPPFGPGAIGECGGPVAYFTDADGDMAESHAPMPAVYVDPQADRIWGIDFAPGTVHLIITRSGSTPYNADVSTTNVLTRGSWNLDMWAAPQGSLQRPAVALFDLDGTFDVQAGDVVTLSDGASVRQLTVADLSVDSVSATTDKVTGHAVQTVQLHLGDGEGGYWGYSAEPTGGEWTYTFTAGVFPNPPDGLSPGMNGQAIINDPSGATIVRWIVPTVSGPSEPSQMVAEVQALGLMKGDENHLLDLLAKAQREYDRGKDKQGTKAMNDFIKRVEKLMPKHISPAAGAQLMSDAQAVIAAHS